ncbi:Ferredoxin subunit of nitrite reductase or a ring-hydroxylating dioxygenase [Friedmanniella luteola]|uniref:Ferredoxin subunit of nitrite reductase or a ring-hydroxylating dioxygenase n=1 Tax=Friedmanniella luteola TaxID=546871 RepID=A0A1H1YTF0_9ACTN|nr:Rieske 2Fe-2S domain-containing protein [Friedmanniella luteola]SDT24711.1 Ferredoxin subunit of nitrite reductase or a ring-hydroxylating dioxygenase [Friedmanniella luteola]
MLNKLTDAVTTRIERAQLLDGPGEKLAALVMPLYTKPAVRHAASGTALGHPLHPLLVTVPIGAWTCAFVFDALGDEKAANVLVATGIVTAVPTAFTGLSDWSYTSGAERRVGLVHAAANTVGLTAYVASWLARRQGRHGLGLLLSTVGMSAVGLGGWMGGHLAYALGVGVDTTAFSHAEDQWTDVAGASEVRAGELAQGDLDGVPLVMTRLADRVVAYADRCTHRGGPLHEGTLEDGCVVCPWHQGTFDLEDGSVVLGPPTRPAPAFEVREVDGRLQARRVDPRSLRTEPVGR